MKKKLLKIQLITLFIVTLFSFIAFYYGNDLPDNAFSINSSNSNFSITYYLISMMSYVSYFSGPWVLLPFLIFSLSMSFLYSRREYMVDVLNFFPLVFLFAGLTYFVAPVALGEGLNYFFKTYSDAMWLSLYLLTSLILYFFGTFRSEFKNSLVATYEFLKTVPGKLSAFKSRISSFFASNKPKDSVLARPGVESKINGLLKNKDAGRPLFLSQGVDKDQKKVNDPMDKSEKADAGAVDKLKGMLPMFLAKKEEAIVEENKFAQTVSSNIEEDKDEVVSPVASEVGFEDEFEFEQPVREKKKIMVSDHKPLNKLADTTTDNKYFDIVSKLGDVRETKTNKEPDGEYFEQIIGLLEAKLAEFKIEGNIVNVLKGPVVDTFEFKPGAGVKVSKIANATEDLSLALYGVPIRVVPSMMGRDTVGIEVPRNPREIIYLDEVLNSKDFQSSDSALPIAMGKDAFGEPFVIDLTSCPHMLVAGATGAGKSVFINSLLVSLLIKKSPKKMKLILIDPKQLELALYAKLPHLVMPVITDAKTAAVALLWAVQEMERRYSILKEFGVRNISGFNEKLEKASPSMLANIHQYYEDQGVDDYELPYLVIIVDEFADLILTKAGKEIENNIARLAAKARAAGIHLILATQRPSVDVITGVIKSNFPTRVSFRVTSQMDSRTILDKIGAERLLGKGDMLYKHGISTQRVHSSFVNEEEIEALTEKLMEIPSEFNENAMNFLETGGEVEVDDYTYGSHIPSSNDSSDDDMYSEALKIVVESRSASASMLQRRLRIGYNRAANLVEEMERRGVVGPAQGSKPRKVLHAGDEAQY